MIYNFNPCKKYEYVIIRNDEEIGINEYGFDYLIKLEQENQELKERLENGSKNYTKYIQQRDNVLDEIREQLKKIKQDLDFEPWSIYKVSGDKLFDLSQILDKVKE